MEVKSIRLLTNKPDKKRQLEEYGISVADVIHTQSYFKDNNTQYLLAKKYKSNHSIAITQGV